jgi:hypothetical protein
MLNQWCDFKQEGKSKAFVVKEWSVIKTQLCETAD